MRAAAPLRLTHLRCLPPLEQPAAGEFHPCASGAGRRQSLDHPELVPDRPLIHFRAPCFLVVEPRVERHDDLTIRQKHRGADQIADLVVIVVRSDLRIILACVRQALAIRSADAHRAEKTEKREARRRRNDREQ